MVHGILAESAVGVEDVPLDEEGFLPGGGLAAEAEQGVADLHIEGV